MFSITLKRSAATLGVLAGLLAAAGPAGASQPASQPGSNAKAVVVLIGANDYGFSAEAQGTQVGSEGVKEPTKADAPDGRKPQGTYDMASPF